MDWSVGLLVHRHKYFNAPIGAPFFLEIIATEQILICTNIVNDPEMLLFERLCGLAWHGFVVFQRTPPFQFNMLLINISISSSAFIDLWTGCRKKYSPTGCSFNIVFFP